VLSKHKVAIITSFPRAQRVHVYNEMARLNEVNFQVFYLRQMPYGRHWEYGPSIEHEAVFIPEIRLRPHLYLSPGLLRAYNAYSPDLMIMTQYASPGMQLIMYVNVIKRKPWIFWSEYPGMLVPYEPIFRNKRLRDIGRKLALLPVKYFPKEIWAIGTSALKAYEKIVSNKIVIRNLPYFADLDVFFEAGADRSNHKKVRFLFCGNLHTVKGFDIVLDAIEKLYEGGLTNFELHVAGTGPLKERLEKQIRTGRKNISYYGFLQLDKIPELYSKTDVLLFPSRYDGWGMTLPEGMAAGMPVISTDQAGSAVDIIVQGENGYRMNIPSTDQLVFYMIKFIQEPDLIRTMGDKAREMAKRYTHHIGARTFLDLIHSVL